MNRAKKISKISGAHRGLAAMMDPHAEDPSPAVQGDIAWLKAKKDQADERRRQAQEQAEKRIKQAIYSAAQHTEEDQ